MQKNHERVALPLRRSTMKKITTIMNRRILSLTAALSVALMQSSLHATPYASSISNDGSGNISFYINESGGTVVVTYEDGSTNANFNGQTTGINTPSGQYSFSLSGHSTYNITVNKTGTGAASLESNVIQAANTYGPATNHILQHWIFPRDVAVNANPTSPYFGRIYVSSAGISATNNNLFDLNPDGSWGPAGSAGSSIGVTTWSSDHDASPYKLSIAANDMVIVSDWSAPNSGVFMTDPNLTTNEVILGPLGVSGTTHISTSNNHGEITSRAWLLGDLNSGTGATLLTVDGTYPNPYNCILAYSNITQSALTSGTGWQNAPATVGGQVAINFDAYLGTGVYVYPGLTVGANGLIYGCQYRSSVGNESGVPGVTVYNSSYTNRIWGSQYNGGASDYFNTASSGAAGTGGACLPVDVAVSPDCKYLATVNFDGHFTICSLTNGIPDASTIYTVEPDAFVAAGSFALDDEIAWDAADNLYVLSYSLQGLKAWTLGLSSQAITSGNASGSTAFNMAFLTTTVNAYATNNPVISQANTYGNPTSGSFTLVRSGGDLSAPLTVNFTYGGTATNGTYTAGSTASVVFAAGQTTTNISIAAVSDGLPRPTTYLTLTLARSISYSLGAQSATIGILNTATPYLMTVANASSMYNAFSNDYVSVTITRWGDTNATTTINSANFTTTGSAVKGTDFTAPPTTTFNPGDLTKTVRVFPLISGAPPVHTATQPFTGNKSIVFSIGSGSGYTVAPGTVTLTIVDSGHPPATVLYSNPLSDPNDATNWNMTAANGNMLNNPYSDVNVIFGQDLTAIPYSSPAYTIGFPPNGSQYALRETVNKSSGTGLNGGAPTVVNVYLTNQVFSGNYAVRFNMNMVEGGNLFEDNFNDDLYNSEEGVLFGINHNGTETNFWVAGSDLLSGGGLQPGSGPWASDGVFYWVSDSGGNYLETWPNYQIFTGNGNPATNGGWAEPLAGLSRTAFTSAFKTNIFTTPYSGFVPPFDTGWTEGGPGLPANGSGEYGLSVSSWSDVEIKQLNGVITMSIDKTPIFVYTNKTMFTSGNIMLGYEDPWDGGEDVDAAVYYSNLQVVRIGPPMITSMGLSGANAVMNFSVSDDGGTFTVQSASKVNGPFSNVTATITPSGNGTFQVTVPQNGSVQFYRILQQ